MGVAGLGRASEGGQLFPAASGERTHPILFSVCSAALGSFAEGGPGTGFPKSSPARGQAHRPDPLHLPYHALAHQSPARFCRAAQESGDQCVALGQRQELSLTSAAPSA